MAPLLTPVSVPGSPPLFWYHPLHAVVVHPSSVSVATAGPAVAQRGGRAFHGTVVAYGLGKERTSPRQREKRRSSFERGAGASIHELRHAVYVWMCSMQLSVSGKTAETDTTATVVTAKKTGPEPIVYPHQL